ncbi:MAG: hypothetical protein M9962_07680 [Oligoflexia bacterium]|nr:hypothetical protein [Oligoflexia bacterium]
MKNTIAFFLFFSLSTGFASEQIKLTDDPSLYAEQTYYDLDYVLPMNAVHSFKVNTFRDCSEFKDAIFENLPGRPSSSHSNVKVEYDSKDRFERLKLNIQLLKINLQSEKLSNQQKEDIQKAIDEGEKKFNIEYEYMKQRRLCIFQKEVSEQISELKLPEHKQFLEKIGLISSCIEGGDDSSFQKIESLANDFFASVYRNFTDKIKKDKKSLTEDDCKVLMKTYSLWSSFYDKINTETVAKSGAKIPLYNVNPHNTSYKFWMQEKAKGSIPANGLPIIHVDTHTDVEHVHVYSEQSGLRTIPLSQYGKLLELAQKGKRDEILSVVSEAHLPKNDKSKRKKEEKDKVYDFFSRASFSEIQSTIIEAAERNAHKIAQPLTAAVASGVSEDVTLILPVWNKQKRETTKRLSNGKIAPYNSYLYASKGDIRWGAKDGELGEYTKADYAASYLRIISPSDSDVEIVRKVDFKVGRFAEESLGLSGQVNFNEEKSRELPDFSEFLPDKSKQEGFILDIDLDAFASEGRESNKAEPISFGRTIHHEGVNARPHGSHQESNETDGRIEVGITELDLIDKRLDVFFERLRRAKEKGYTPKVISIADSTMLQRALKSKSASEDFFGGYFTPSCLVFLLNYKIRRGLEGLYNIKLAQ